MADLIGFLSQAIGELTASLPVRLRWIRRRQRLAWGLLQSTLAILLAAIVYAHAHR